MKYTISTTTTNTTYTTTIDALDMRAAHAAADVYKRGGAIVRVYPALDTAAGIVNGALTVARRTAANSIKRTGGSTTQWTILRDLDHVAGAAAAVDSAAAADAADAARAAYIAAARRAGRRWILGAAARARRVADRRGIACGQAAARRAAALESIIDDMQAARQAAGIVRTPDTAAARAAAIMQAIAACGHDSQEYMSAAAAALAEYAGGPVDAAYHAAYLAVNAHIRSLRTAAARELSIEYVRDGGGDVVEFGAAIAAIISGGDKWTPAASARLTRQEAAYYGRALRGALAACTPAQQQIARLLAAGYSQAQIAARLGRTRQTITRNVAIMRAAISDYIAAHAPLLAARIDTDTVAAQAAGAAAGNRTEAGMARSVAAQRATQAERARAYRARKAAARAAAKAALDAAAADAADAAARDTAAQARAAADAAAQARQAAAERAALEPYTDAADAARAN